MHFIMNINFFFFFFALFTIEIIVFHIFLLTVVRLPVVYRLNEQ